MKSMSSNAGRIEPRRSLGWVVRVAAVMAVLFGLERATRADATAPRAETTVADLATHVATSDSFYLLLDATRGQLTLELRGAVLHNYNPLAIEIGRTRVAWVRGAPPAHFDAARWRHGRLVPPRPEERMMVVPGAAESLLVEQLRSPGPAATPAPDVFWIAFEGDRELHIKVEGSELKGLPDLFSNWRTHVHEIRQALRGGGERWRITLPREQADHLYRSLPPDTWLLIYRGSLQPPPS